MYKLFTIILFFLYPQVSSSTQATSYAEKIVDSLYMVELSVNGVVNHLTEEWSDVPEVALGLKCFESEASPRLKNFYVDGLESSIAPKILKTGSILTAKAGVVNAKEFILSADFADEAKSKSVRADVYTLIMAAQQTESSISKKELIDASNWLKTNGPIFSNTWGKKIEQFQGIIQGALGSCFDMEST